MSTKMAFAFRTLSLCETSRLIASFLFLCFSALALGTGLPRTIRKLNSSGKNSYIRLFLVCRKDLEEEIDPVVWKVIRFGDFDLEVAMELFPSRAFPGK
jgi:hypothetical protein